MLNNQLKEDIIQFAENTDILKDKLISINVQLSNNADNYDRHFTSFSKMEFIMKNFSWRISGGRLIFEGEDQYYEIAADLVISFQNNGNEIIFIEKYSNTVHRKSIIKY